MNPINFDFLKAIVLPALIYSSAISLVVAVVIVGAIASAIERKKDRFSVKEARLTPIQIVPNPILFPIYGSFIGLMLLTFLPIQADRGFRNNGIYVGIWLFQKLIVLAPLGSILGATTGCIIGEQLNRKVNLRHMWIGLGITYSIMAFTIYTSLVPPPLQMLKPVAKSGDFLLVIAEISCDEKGIKDLAFRLT
jgi:hypothetical protein